MRPIPGWKKTRPIAETVRTVLILAFVVGCAGIPTAVTDPEELAKAPPPPPRPSPVHAEAASGPLVGLGGLLHGKNGWWNIDNCATIPGGAIPAPPGTHTNGLLMGQAARAEAEDFHIYHHEWYRGGVEPGPAGRRHLEQIAARWGACPYPVVVQVEEPEETRPVSREEAIRLNNARRSAVVAFLSEKGLKDADARVVLGYPSAEGLYGTTAAEIGAEYLFSQGGRGQTGNFSGGAGGMLGGFGGSGMGGGLGGFGGSGVGGFY